MSDAMFWADRKAREVLERRRFRYLEREVPEPERYVVKSSASISGALHIGRLSDTIRGECVVRALSQAGVEAALIWVAEDMDPLRSVPEGAPAELAEYIGMPVSSVPDPWGCHGSYAEHHVEGYLEVMRRFLEVEPEMYSMREEYRRGSFAPYIRKLLENMELVREIVKPSKEAGRWSPFVPVCRGCGRIITPRVEGVERGRIRYTCRDYEFEKHTARGCGFSGYADPLRDEGKLMWKSEWAAQWARWQVCCEGAGKEYVVPGSAWWVNAEICERILGFPMPVPLFYEHLLIDGRKMSASVGNVVYPEEWLEVAPPQLLRFLYCKKIMKSRSFSWRELPKLYDEYDRVARVYFGMERAENEAKERHLRRLYEFAQVGEPMKPVPLPFSHAAVVACLFEDGEALESLKRSGHYSQEVEEELRQRIAHARAWVERYAPEMRLSLLQDFGEVRERLDAEQLAFLCRLREVIEKQPEGERLQEEMFRLAKEMGLGGRRAFEAVYLAMLGRRSGPRAGPFVASLRREWVLQRLEEACAASGRAAR